MKTIEHCNGRIEAFTEVKQLLSFIVTTDKTTSEQLEILRTHIDKQIELDTSYIDKLLDLMECQM